MCVGGLSEGSCRRGSCVGGCFGGGLFGGDLSEGLLRELGGGFALWLAGDAEPGAAACFDCVAFADGCRGFGCFLAVEFYGALAD